MGFLEPEFVALLTMIVCWKGLKKGRWSDVEDEKLMELALENLDPKSQESGQNKINWGVVAKQIPGRTAKQCRER